MKRTTSLLTTGALGLGSFALLSTVAPGIAGANGCGVTTLDLAQLEASFSSPLSGVGGGATAEMLPDGLRLTTPADDPDAEAYAAYFMDGLQIPLAEATAQSNFVLDATLAAGQPIANHPTYELYLDLDATDGIDPDEALLVYWQPAAGDPDGIWWSAFGPLSELDPESIEGTDEATLVDVSAAYPTATITAFGFQLLYQAGADVTVHGLTFGCNDFVLGSGPVDPVNEPPTAAFTATGDGTARTFTATASDPDGTVERYTWDFGDGSAPVDGGAEISHTYAASGSYTVTLTVADDAGAEFSTQLAVTVTVPGTGGPTDPTDPTDPADPTEYGSPLPNTGADVLGLAAIGGLVLAGGGAGLVASRRRRAGSAS
ncbi:PKD domain-containing protein [Geodermatophilus marinus]|uniref:PKD domain-containing protein n=1 Tax=Geodermatophilus sp. LHW52908 TaxID=2303986 RepID=UPI000E3EA68C|nr:PKD domain-containing protein [Geodermatophilus sp. LHW52908]RFU20205.1 PKD domain-containing protein [Geodermatophilus sp. LHW52908]